MYFHFIAFHTRPFQIRHHARQVPL
jgi:hypothetical protein